MHKGISVLVMSILLLASIFTYSQNKTLQVNLDSQTSHQQVTDSIGAAKLVNNVLHQKRSEGFLNILIQSQNFRNDTFFYNILLGKRYTQIHIRSHNLDSLYLPLESSFHLGLREFSEFQKSILDKYENNGYPFASISLQKNAVRSDTLSCDLIFYPFTQIRYDSLVYYGNSKISKKYISKYLGLEEGRLYNEENVSTIDKKLRNLPIMKLTRPSQVIFTREKARIILYIEDVVTDRLDGVVGIAPNSNNSEGNNLLLTGELNIELNNLFRSGKQLGIHWRNYLQRSQKLDVNFAYPYLFNTKIGINGELNLNKFDTLFLNVMNKLSFRYQQKGNNYIEFYYQNIRSTLLSVDTNSIINRKLIPDNNPYRVDNYGLVAFSQDLDYLQNPRRGYHIKADFSVGQKTILKNSEINAIKFINENNNSLITVYNTVSLKSIRLDLKLSSSFFIPVKKRATIYQKLEFNGIFTDQVFFNELYNFGGYSSLRGFDENELFASKALLYNIEFRYLIGQNSHVGLFMNAAAIEDKLRSDDLVYDTPVGFGALANIEVGKGVLSMAYALGSQQGNELQLSTAKFHFGIINYF